MPKQVTRNNLLSKLGDKGRKAHEQHKADETNYGNMGELPPGIENGIAQLVECKFDEYKTGDNKGKLFFYAAGVVVAPETMTVQDTPKSKPQIVPVKGLRTSIMEPLCETPNKSRKSIEEHMEWIENELRKLGLDTSSIDFDDLEVAIIGLKESKPHFRFRTWKSKPTTQFPDPRTNHSWAGVVEYEDEEGGEGVEDETPDVEEQEEAVEEEAPPTKAAAKGKPAVKKPASKNAPEEDDVEEEAAEEEEVEASEEEGDDDLETVIEAAVADDEDAQRKLNSMALALGVSQEEINDAADWEAVGELAKAAKEGSNEDSEEVAEEEAFEPSKGDVYLYKVIDPKTKKPAKAGTDCEVISVNKKSETCTLKNLETNKLITDPKTKKPLEVKWSDLESQE